MLSTRGTTSPRTTALSVAATLALTVAAGVVTAAPASAAVTNCGPTFSGGDGSSATPYLISAGADLTALLGDSDCWASTANFLQTTDITLAATWTTTIGTSTTNFNGTYNGGGHQISGITVNLSGPYAGLFGYVGSSGQISNLGFTGNVTGTLYVGGIIGYNNGGDVSNAHTSGNVTGSSDYVGGIIGYNTSGGTVGDTYASGNITGNDLVGGIIGYNNGGDVSNAHTVGDVAVTYVNGTVGGLIGYNARGEVSSASTTGDVTGGTYVGGLIGYNTKPVSDSHATGDVTALGGSSSTGGLIGYNSSGSDVTSSYATGNVAGTNHTGGLIGNNSSSVTNSYATGSVSTSGSFGSVGGLIGYNSSGSDVTSSYATGSISGTAYAGGLIGNNSSSVTNSYATGTVSATTPGTPNAGGLIGNNSSSVTNCYATGTVSATSTGADSYVGGLIGINSSAVSDSYATGTVSATTPGTAYAGGFIGDNSSGTWSDAFFLDAGAYNGEGTLVSSTQLRDITTFITAGWSIAAGWSSSGSPVWGICGPANNGYPFLNPTVATNPCAGTAARVEFTFYLPDGRECTNISPSYVILNSQVALPQADADCRTTAGSSIIGWTIPTPRTFTGIGSPQMPFAPGALVNVTDSQQFTAVLREPTQQYDYDSNLAAITPCTPTLTTHVTQDGRVHHIWVPRTDISLARFPLTAACTPQGHQLIAWTTNGDGTGTTYSPGDPLPTDWADDNFNTRTLYATWGS